MVRVISVLLWALMILIFLAPNASALFCEINKRSLKNIYSLNIEDREKALEDELKECREDDYEVDPYFYLILAYTKDELEKWDDAEWYYDKFISLSQKKGKTAYLKEARQRIREIRDAEWVEVEIPIYAARGKSDSSIIGYKKKTVLGVRPVYSRFGISPDILLK